jgi:hypothetical protein
VGSPRRTRRRGLLCCGRASVGFDGPWRRRPPCGSPNLAQADGHGKPVFAIAPYEPDETGVLRPVLPERCVFATAAETCSLCIDHYRPRKTGPGFPLAVVGCTCHPHGRYTLYPPGHIPYGRQQVVPCSPSGPLLRDPATGQPEWPATVFGAAIDAAEGQRWSAHSPADDARRRRTQGCRLELAGTLLGVHPDLEARPREWIATRLRVPTMTLRSAAGRWATRWPARGTAVLAVLHALPLDQSLLDRLLAAGAITGLWPSPQRWDPLRRTWVRPPSGGPAHPVASASASRAPPPTNLPAV